MTNPTPERFSGNTEGLGKVIKTAPDPCPLSSSLKSLEGKNEARPLGCALAMRVLQSDLYPTLDGAERADCDELIHQNMAWFKRWCSSGVLTPGNSNGVMGDGNG